MRGWLDARPFAIGEALTTVRLPKFVVFIISNRVIIRYTIQDWRRSCGIKKSVSRMFKVAKSMTKSFKIFDFETVSSFV